MPTATILPVFLTAARKVAGVVHGVGGGLFDVGIAAGVDGFDAMLRVLEVGGGDEDGIDVFARVELVVVAHRVDGTAAELLDEGRAFFAAAVPDVGDGDELEVQLLGVLLEGGDQRALHAVAAADDADADAVVGADDGGVAARVPGDGGCGNGCAADLQKLPAIVRTDASKPSGVKINRQFAGRLESSKFEGDSRNRCLRAFVAASIACRARVRSA